MSAGLSSVSNDELMRMLGAARGGAGGSTSTVPSPFADEPPAASGGLSIRVRPNSPGQPVPTSPDTAPAAVDLSGLSDGDLMRQLMGARSSAAKAPAAPASFDDRFGAGTMARLGQAPQVEAGDGTGPASVFTDQGAADALQAGLQGQADRRLVGEPSAGNAAGAALLRAGNAAGLNIPRNVGAAIASLPGVGNGRSFGENYQLARDQEEALARQSPKSALAGTIGGVIGGALALPGLGGAASLKGRAVQAGLTGGAYGFAGELFDTKDIGSAGYAGIIGAGLGGAGLIAVEKAAPVVMRLAQRGISVFRPTAPGGPPALTDEAVAALREVGVDPASLPADLEARLSAAFTAKGASPAVAREALAADQGITLSRGQATQDPRALALEGAALGGARGARAQQIGEDFATRQAGEIGAARDRLQAMAARGGETIDNPQAAYEAAADRARLASEEAAQRTALAQQGQREALQAVRGPAGSDPLAGAETAVTGLREAAEQARGAYRSAYGEVGQIPGQFAPGALDDVGAVARRGLGPEVPVDEVLTPATARALADLDNLPAVLGLRPGEGPTLQQLEQMRKRLVAYQGNTGQNPTDRRALGRVIDAFDQRAEDMLAVGQFRQQPPALPAPARGAPDGFPVEMPPAPAAAPRGEPESLTRYIARNGGLPLDDEARAADLNRLYVPGAGTLARRNGTTWDDLRVRLVEEGFLPPGEGGAASARDVRDWVLDALQREQRGQPVYRIGDQGRVSAQEAGRVSDEAADYAARLDREARRTAIALEAEGLSARDLDPATLRDAAEMILRREADNAGDAYEAAARARQGGAPARGDALPDAPFPDLGDGFGPAASDALPIGDTGPAEALRRARGLFRDYRQAFAPRGPGDVAGQRLQRIVERDASPSDVVSALFGTTTGKVGSGQLQTLARVRDAVGADSDAWRAVQRSVVARYLDGSEDALGRRLDYLLREDGRPLLAFLSPEQKAGLGRLRGAVHQAQEAGTPLPPWVAGLERKGFDPNAIGASLFGSGVPGGRVGAVNEAKAAKAFLSEDSAEWSMLRQAAVQRVIDPEAGPQRIVERIQAFTHGPGAGVAREMFTASEREQFQRLVLALKSATLPDGRVRSDAAGQRAIGLASKAVDLLMGAIAFKAAGPGAAVAAYSAKAGQRALIGGLGAQSARRSFEGGAPRARPSGPVLDLAPVGVGSGLATEYGLPQ